MNARVLSSLARVILGGRKLGVETRRELATLGTSPGNGAGAARRSALL